MAEDYEFKEDYDKALDYYENALKIYQDMGLKDQIDRINRGLKKVKDWMKDVEEYDEYYMYNLDSKDFL